MNRKEKVEKDSLFILGVIAVVILTLVFLGSIFN